ncbi:MAG: hypothetical protein WC242_00860 [Candidatus Paceibacterota bacterium]|jgi:hypothetical protein
MFQSLNLIENLRQQKKLKIAFFYLLGLFLSFVFWFSIKANYDLVFMGGDETRSLATTFFVVVVFCLLFASFANSVYFLKKFYLVLGLVVLINIPYSIVFGFSLFSLEGFLILILGFYFWAKRIYKYTKHHPVDGPLVSGYAGLRWAITIFLCVIAFSFYISIAYRGQINYFVPRLENYLISMSHQSMKWILPGYNKKLSVDESLSLIAKNKFWSRFAFTSGDIGIDSPEVILLMRQNLENKMGIRLEGRNADFLMKKFIHDYVSENLMRSQKLFSGAAAVAFFLFLKLFMFVYILLIRLFSWMWLKIFFLLKVVYKTTETIEVEKITI